MPSKTTRIDLPSGGWVELRDPESIRAGDQEDIMRGCAKPDLDRPLGFGFDVSNGLKCLMIEKWDVPYLQEPTRLPVDAPWQLRELTPPDDRALDQALLPAQQCLFPTPVSIDDKQLEDKASPTTPASV